VCCRADSGAPKDAKDAAGHWGSIGPCEIPYRTIESALRLIATDVRPDIVLWLGDNVHGLMHSQSQVAQLEALTNLTKMFQLAFAGVGHNDRRPIILPILGNHEGYPTDTFNFRNISSEAWLLHTTAKLWQPFLSADAIAQYNRTGYYTQIIPGMPGLRVIALNCLLYGDNNVYTMANSTDPLGQLAWVNETLAKAEAASEKVIVITHVPTCCEKGTEGASYHISLRLYGAIDDAARAIFE
jgi:sphingomyelin phosphodiesterase